MAKKKAEEVGQRSWEQLLLDDLLPSVSPQSTALRQQLYPI